MSESRKQDDNHNDYYGKNELLLNENSLESYNNYIVREFVNFSKIKEKIDKSGTSREFRVLDFGAGYGTLAIIWKKMTGQDVECLEVDKDQQKAIHERGFVVWDSLDPIDDKFEFIYSSNVLEHIEDDEKCIKDLADSIVKGGRIGIYVPAFMALFSDLDRQVGHYRRYEKMELISKVNRAGLSVVHCKYVDSIGFFASLLIKILGWKSVGNIGGVTSLKIYDTYIFPISRFIDWLSFGRILGKNIILIAEKNEDR